MMLNLESNGWIKGQSVGRRQIGIAHVRSSVYATVSKAEHIGSTCGATAGSEWDSRIESRREPSE